MIVRNEEATIRAVLTDAAQVCDELIVVDTGSTDSTVEIARECGAQVFEFEWIDDFSAARNYSFQHCTGEWILWLDADDRIPPLAQEGFASLKARIESGEDIDGVMIPYRRHFSETDPEICTYSFDRERVLRRAANHVWLGPVHEVIALGYGRSIRWPDAWVEHRPLPESWDRKVDRNLRILERAVADGDRSPRTLFYYANEVRHHKRWDEALAVYRDYVEVSDLVWEKYSALLSMADCATVLEHHNLRIHVLLEAVSVDSSRAEAFNQLGVIYYERREWKRAIPLFAAAIAAERPEEGFISNPVYDWLASDYLAVCLSNVGRFEEAMEHSVRALPSSPDRKRILDNLVVYADSVEKERRQNGSAGS